MRHCARDSVGTSLLRRYPLGFLEVVQGFPDLAAQAGILKAFENMQLTYWSG